MVRKKQTVIKKNIIKIFLFLFLLFSAIFLLLIISVKQIFPLFLQKIGIPFKGNVPDLDTYLEEKTGIPYKEGRPDLEAFNEEYREKLISLNVDLLYKTPWNLYQSENFPFSVMLPDTFTASESPIFHRIDLESGKYGVQVDVVAYLAEPLEKDEVEQYLNRKVDTIAEGVPDRSYRFFDYTQMTSKILPSGRKVYIKNPLNQAGSVGYSPASPLEIYFSLDKWQFVVGLRNAEKEINEFTQPLVEKIADNLFYQPIPESVFIEYWVRPLAPLKGNIVEPNYPVDLEK